MRIESVSGMPSEVERPATTGAVAAAATEIKLHTNDLNAPVTAVAEVHKDVQSAPNGRGETVWLDNEKQVFRIVDQHSGEIVYQVPSEEVLRVARNLEGVADDDTKQNLDIRS